MKTKNQKTARDFYLFLLKELKLNETFDELSELRAIEQSTHGYAMKAGEQAIITVAVLIRDLYEKYINEN